MLWLMTAMLVSSLNSVHVAVATTSSEGNDPVDITDLAVELQGYDGVRYAYTYDEWRAYLKSINIPYGDNYLSAGYWVYSGGVKMFVTPSYIPPENFLLLEYTNTQSGKTVYVEIYEYECTENATAAFGNQHYGEFYYGRIFDRFSAVQVMLHRGQFVVFIFCPTEQPDMDTLAQSTLNDCTQKFVDNLFNVLPGSTQPSPPPSVDFTGEVVWGVKPGDIISWESSWETFTGYVGGGMGHKEGSLTIVMEIVQITDDNLAVLIRSPEKYHEDFDYFDDVPYGLNLVLPPYRYYWATVTHPVTPPHGEYREVLIFPIYSEGQTLKDRIESNTDWTDIRESAEYITFHYKTAPAEGYTPIETEWKDVTLHKGSGIVTSEEWYYNNNEYSITTTYSLTLKETNFDLSSRVPPLMVPTVANPATIYSGGTSTIGVFVISGETLITGATVSLSSGQGGTFSTVTDHANGTYTATYTAPDITTEIICSINALASKAGDSGSGKTQVTVEPLALNIYAKDAEGNPIDDVTVVSTSQPSGQTALSGTTDADGFVAFIGILKGSYTIKLTKSGYPDTTWTGTVLAGQITTQIIAMTQPFPWIYLIVVVVAALAVVEAAFALKMRRPKT